MNANKLRVIHKERPAILTEKHESSDISLMLIKCILSTRWDDDTKRTKIWQWMNNRITTVGLIEDLFEEAGLEL